MRVKLRPGVHFVPVPRGVQWTRGNDSFLLTAPPALYQVLDAQVGALAAGTSLDELVAAVGDPAARPVLARVLRVLVHRDVLLDLDRVAGPQPDAATAARYAEVLAYLEAHCAEPYRTFAALRATRVAVRGTGPAVPVLHRTLRRYGVVVDAEGADLTVCVDEPPAAWPALPVRCGPHLALVGPVCTGPEALAAVADGYRRAAAWARAEPADQAPWPLCAVLAGSLAAHRILARLTGTEPDPRDATVVYGRHVATRAVPLPRAVPPPATVDGMAADLAEPVPDPATAWAPFTARWTGPVRRGQDGDLPQLPLALATACTVDTGAPAAGWGTDRAEATAQALLAAARRLVPSRPVPAAGGAVAVTGGPAVTGPAAVTGAAGGTGVPAAGATRGRWLVDGVLRLLGADLLAAAPGEPVDWADLTDDSARSLWDLMEEYFARPVRVRVRLLDGTDWALASVTGAAGTGAAGEVAAGQWGPDPGTAIRAGLAAAVAAAQADPAVRALLSAESTGTQVLLALPGDRLEAGARQLEKLLAHRGRRVAGTVLSAVDGPVYGPVWLS